MISYGHGGVAPWIGSQASRASHARRRGAPLWCRAGDTARCIGGRRQRHGVQPVPGIGGRRRTGISFIVQRFGNKIEQCNYFCSRIVKSVQSTESGGVLQMWIILFHIVEIWHCLMIRKTYNRCVTVVIQPRQCRKRKIYSPHQIMLMGSETATAPPLVRRKISGMGFLSWGVCGFVTKDYSFGAVGTEERRWKWCKNLRVWRIWKGI